MTCIVAIKDKGRVWIGGDSAGVAGLNVTIRADEKVFENGDFIMGFCGSFRMGQLLRYAFNPPKRHADTDIYKYMVTDFVDAVRSCLKNGGVAEKHNDAEKGGFFLVGYEGRLFEIESDYQVGESIEAYSAIGCGGEYAYGALAASEGQKPEARIKIALAAAEKFSAGVRAPFHILNHERKAS